MAQTPKLEEVIEMAVDERLDHVYTAMPGRIEDYDPQFQSASVKPLVTFERITEDGSRVADSLPIIGGVPVVFPGAGSFSMTFPLFKGDTGLLIFANCSLDQWLTLGGEVNPASDRRHSIADAIFIPGLRPFSRPIGHSQGTPPSQDAMVLRGVEIRIGDDDADDPVVRKSDLDAFVEEYLFHTHPDPSSGSTGVPTTSFTSPDCSNTVKVK